MRDWNERRMREQARDWDAGGMPNQGEPRRGYGGGGYWGRGYMDRPRYQGGWSQGPGWGEGGWGPGGWGQGAFGGSRPGNVAGDELGVGWRDRARFWAEMGRGGPFAGRGPRGYQRSDERILEDVSDRLSDDPWLDASGIEVRVEEAIVILTGTVDSRDAKRRAEDVAESSSGVRDVTNQLRVDQGQGGEATGQEASPTGRQAEQPSR